MESQSPTSTTTSTTSEQDNMPSSQSASVDKTSTLSNTDPTLSIPNPTYSPLIQQHVTNAAAIIASNHLTRNMFIVEVFKKCSEIALWEKRTRKTAPELLPEFPKLTGESPHSSHSYSSDVQHITPEGDDVLEQIHKEVFNAQNHKSWFRINNKDNNSVCKLFKQGICHTTPQLQGQLILLLSAPPWVKKHQPLQYPSQLKIPHPMLNVEDPIEELQMNKTIRFHDDE